MAFTESSAELQKAVFDRMTGDAALMAILNAVYDRVPGEPFGDKTAYGSFGPQDDVEDDAECINGREITLQVDIWSRAVGRVECKRAVDLLRRLFHRKPLALTTHAVADVWVNTTRIIDDPDGLTTHGVVPLTVMLEETQ